MKIQTGNPVRGDDFFKRENLIQKAWDLIDSGNHILFAAPRRVGKTSLMFYLMDYSRADYGFVYLNTQSTNNENEFFRRIVNKVLKTDLIKNSQKLISLLKIHRPTIKKVGPDGIEFGVSENHNYLEMLSQILKSASYQNKKLIVMLDEFPETLENIIEDADEKAGRHFLQSNRELRQDAELARKVQFIYTGSIGLENIVSKMNAVNTINDLSRLKIPPLQTKEAEAMIQLLRSTIQVQLSKRLVSYILEKIEWLIPFYIQLVMQELKFLSTNQEIKMNKQMIDQAFQMMLEQRQHFEHWHTRLRNSYKGSDYNFVKEILNFSSENSYISANEIFNLAIKYNLGAGYKDLVAALVYDGYINNHDDEQQYRYNSPILRIWWQKNVAH